MASHSSTLAWKTPWMEEPGRLQSMGREESDTTEQLHFHFSHSCIGEGNGTLLQYSCLENPRDGGAWWGSMGSHSQTRLKWLSSSRGLLSCFIWTLKKSRKYSNVILLNLVQKEKNFYGPNIMNINDCFNIKLSVNPCAFIPLYSYRIRTNFQIDFKQIYKL